MKRIIVSLIAVMMVLPAAFTAAASDFQNPSVVTDTKPAKKKKGEVKDVVFSVHLHCENCVKKVQENIAFEKGVKDLKVSLDDQTVALKYDAAKTSEETLRTAIEELGYPVSGKLEPGQKVEHHHHHGHDHQH